MTILLHVSDIHFGQKHEYANWRSHGEHGLADSILQDLRQLNIKPDCLVLSGDLTERAEPDEFEKTHGFVEKILGELNLAGKDQPPVVIVPGNHDINWSNYIDASGKRQAFINYAHFYSLVYPGQSYDRNDRYTTSWRNNELFVLGLNSCHLESPEMAGMGYVEPEQLREAEQKYEAQWNTCPIRIAVIHHHLVPVPWNEFESPSRPGKPFAALKTSLTLNTEQIMSWMNRHGFQAVLHGHQHQPFIAEERRYGQMRNGHSSYVPKLLLIGAGSAGIQNEYLGTIRRRHYNIITIAPHALEIRSRCTNAQNDSWDDQHSSPIMIPLPRTDLCKKFSEILNNLKTTVPTLIQQADLIPQAGRSVPVTHVSVDPVSILPLFPSILKTARTTLSTSALPTTVWNSAFGDQILHITSKINGANQPSAYRRLFIGATDDNAIRALISSQEESGVKARHLSSWHYKTIAQDTIVKILDLMDSLDIKPHNRDYLIANPHELALAIYGSEEDAFIGYDYDSETSDNFAIGFLFDPPKELLTQCRELLEFAWKLANKTRLIEGTLSYNAVLLFGAQRWNREKVIRNALEAGLRVYLAENRGDSFKVNPALKAMVHGVLPYGPHAGQHNYNLVQDLDQLTKTMKGVSRNSWCLLGLDDYVCEIATYLAKTSDIPYFPPESDLTTRYKDRLRKLWNEFCQTSSDSSFLMLIPYKYFQYRDFDGINPKTVTPSPEFDAWNGSCIIKPNQLSASIAIFRQENCAEIDSTVKVVLKTLAGLAEQAEKFAIRVEPEVLVEAEIPRHNGLHHGSEYSAEFISIQGNHSCLGITQKWIQFDQHLEVGHLFPADTFPSTLRPVLLNAVSTMLKKLNVKTAISHWEFIVTQDNKLAMVEAQLRPAGDRIMDLIELATGESPYEMLFRSMSGRANPVPVHHNNNKAMIAYLKPTSPLDRIELVDIDHAALEVLGVEYYCDTLGLKHDKAWVGPSHWSNRYLYLIASGASFEEAYDKCTQASKAFTLKGQDEHGAAAESGLDMILQKPVLTGV